MKNVCVIGGGAAGLMAAYAAAENGNRVVLLEKNEKLGKKIYITGKGRCNITNDISPDEFLENVVHGKKFLTGVIYAFPPRKIIEFFETHGLSVKLERGGRVLSRLRSRKRRHESARTGVPPCRRRNLSRRDGKKTLSASSYV